MFYLPSWFLNVILLSQVIALIEATAAITTCEKCVETDDKNATCGSDGKVYPSLCHLKEVACRSGSNITSVDWKTCNSPGEDASCPSICLRIQDPVCGEDGKVYPNECFMRQKNCGKKLAQREMNFCFKTLRQSRRLSGNPSCPSECLDFYRPICGSDGEIYDNHCRLRQKNCNVPHSERVFEVPSSLCLSKSRCPKTCLPLPDPVCGSDGKVYLNQCQMHNLNCGKKVTRLSPESCTRDKK